MASYIDSRSGEIITGTAVAYLNDGIKNIETMTTISARDIIDADVNAIYALPYTIPVILCDGVYYRCDEIGDDDDE